LQLDQGYLIVLEGIDGTGKSTHTGKLQQALMARGLPVLRFFEPTKGSWGMKIRMILTEGRGDVSPEEELSWFINDRKEDVEKNIQPALDEKNIVVMDRYYYSTAAYQGALGFDPAKIIRDNEAFAPKPDRVLIFNAPPEECLGRIEKSRESKSEFEKLEYLKKVQAIFDTFEGPNIRRIDSRPPQDKVHSEVLRQVEDLFPG
jgi:dTMP kinase